MTTYTQHDPSLVEALCPSPGHGDPSLVEALCPPGELTDDVRRCDLFDSIERRLGCEFSDDERERVKTPSTLQIMVAAKAADQKESQA